MKSLVITAFMLLTLAVGANAQENQKVFTAEVFTTDYYSIFYR